MSGTRKALRLLAKLAPPKRAMAASGEKLGGCGMSLAAAATNIIPERTVIRLLFIIFIVQVDWLVSLTGSKSQNQNPFVGRLPGTGEIGVGCVLGWV